MDERDVMDFDALSDEQKYAYRIGLEDGEKSEKSTWRIVLQISSMVLLMVIPITTAMHFLRKYDDAITTFFYKLITGGL